MSLRVALSLSSGMVLYGLGRRRPRMVSDPKVRLANSMAVVAGRVLVLPSMTVPWFMPPSVMAPALRARCVNGK